MLMQQERIENGDGYQTVERAFELLESLAGGPRGVTELAVELGLEKSTVSRMLKTLAGLGYAVQPEKRGAYQLGPRVLYLADRYLDANRLIREARPVLERLALEARASAHLAREVGSQFLVVAKEASPELIQVASAVGGSCVPHASALGKVLLAGMKPALRMRWLQDPLQRFTEKTIVDRAALADEFELIERRGYALEAGEEHLGVGCIGAPVRDAGGRWIAALSISGPLRGTPFKLDREHIELLLAHARALSAALGYREAPAAAPVG